MSGTQAVVGGVEVLERSVRAQPSHPAYTGEYSKGVAVPA
jgi:hypothetical protein